MARRDEGTCWAYSTEEQRSPRGPHRRSNAAGISPRAARVALRALAEGTSWNSRRTPLRSRSADAARPRALHLRYIYCEWQL